jgi:hypothetical protein
VRNVSAAVINAASGPDIRIRDGSIDTKTSPDLARKGSLRRPSDYRDYADPIAAITASAARFQVSLGIIRRSA